MGCHGSILTTSNNGPGDEILNKLLPHDDTGYVWLILLFVNTSLNQMGKIMR
jgi:hypothetical protein